MSLVLCNVGSSAPRSRSNASDQNAITSSSATHASARSSTAHSVMPMSSSASALNRMHGVIHQSPSSSTLNQASIANDNNNNSKKNYTESDDVNQVTIYRYEVKLRNVRNLYKAGTITLLSKQLESCNKTKLNNMIILFINISYYGLIG